MPKDKEKPKAPAAGVPNDDEIRAAKAADMVVK